MSGWLLDTPVRQLPLNSGGRDFAVGDLHGCIDTLHRALASVQFNPNTDRLFSVGDLIDRGPDSVSCTELLEKPWFYACLGNHESVLLDFVYSQDEALATRWRAFGGEWFFQLGFQQQARIAKLLLRHCSFAIELRAAADSPAQVAVGMVHADVPADQSWQSFTAQVGENPDLQHFAMWARERGRGERDDCIAGVEQVLSGHQIVPQAHQAGNVWLLDTGAYRAQTGSGEQQGALTLLELPGQLHRF